MYGSEKRDNLSKIAKQVCVKAKSFMLFFYPRVPHGPTRLGNEWRKKVLFTQRAVFFFDIIEHLGGVQKKCVPSPPYFLNKARINSQCESFLSFVTIWKSNFLFMFYMLLESL